jgi:hypothetical protein
LIQITRNEPGEPARITMTFPGQGSIEIEGATWFVAEAFNEILQTAAVRSRIREAMSDSPDEEIIAAVAAEMREARLPEEIITRFQEGECQRNWNTRF